VHILRIVALFFILFGSDVVFTSAVVLFEVLLGYSVFQWSTQLCIRELDHARGPINNGVGFS